MMEGIQRKMGDPRRLTLPCEFGNNTKRFSLAESQRRNGCRMRSTRNKKKKNIGKPAETFTKRNNHNLRKNWT